MKEASYFEGWTSQRELWRMQGMTKPDTPFPKHWLYYILLKYVVI